jgi:hypothetical protein
MEKEKQKIGKGPATEEVFKVLPPENVRAYLDIYHAMKKVDLKAAVDATMPSFPLEEVERRFLELLKMHKSGWLSKEDLEEHVTREAWTMRAIGNARGGLSAVRAHLRKHIRPQGAPKDYALTFLVYALAHDMKRRTDKPGKPEIGLILKFLDEQNIPHNSTYQNIRMRYIRTSPEEVVENFLSFSVASQDFCAQAFKNISVCRSGFGACLLWSVLHYMSFKREKEGEQEMRMCPVTRHSLKNRT